MFLRSCSRYLVLWFALLLCPAATFADELDAKVEPTRPDFMLKGAVQKHVRRSLKGDYKSGEAKEAKGAENSLNANLTEQAEREENEISWDRWRNRVHRAVWARFCRLLRGGDAFMLGNLVFKYGNLPAPKFPLGTKASYLCTVSREGSLIEAKIIKSSGNKQFDDLMLGAVRSIEGKGMLRFPQGSKRQEVSLSSSLFTTKAGRYNEREFGDIEKVIANSQ